MLNTRLRSLLCTIAMSVGVTTATATADTLYNYTDGVFTYKGGTVVSDSIIEYNGSEYITSSDGKPVIGWIKNGDAWYYSTTSGELQTGWIVCDNKSFYLNNDSMKLQTGLISTPIGMAYMQTSGENTLGWSKINGDWYYFETKEYKGCRISIAKIGWLENRESWYYFYPDGKMAREAYIDGYFLDSQGVWRK